MIVAAVLGHPFAGGFLSSLARAIVKLQLKRSWQSSTFRRTVGGKQLVFGKYEPTTVTAAEAEALKSDIGAALVVVEGQAPKTTKKTTKKAE